ncbi:MAG TPA: type IV secretory system conjugative DNA transfer family protein, partial [Nitrosomonas sp.]|nr:type IV secretory system conjugative DNA transfer family protein [Nitrosomonas sp.]
MNKNSFLSQNNRSSKKDTLIIRLLSVVCLIGGFQVATQYFAYKFSYQPQLGTHFFNIYEPWAILLWANKWYGEYSGIFNLAAGFGILFSSIGLILVLVIKMVLANSSRTNQGLHGSARWADKQDIVAAGLLATGKNNKSDAVYVGGWRDNSGKTRYLKHSGPEHVLCYAPTRSGKGVSLVIPTLLSWTQSAVITDLKGELWALTSGWRKHHAKNKVLRFDPASTSSAHWNPLDEIQIGSGLEVADVQNLTTLIVDPDGKGLQTHWQKTSQALLVGVILHVLYKSGREGTPATLSTVDSMLSDPDRDIRELWMEMAMQDYLDGKSHPVIAASARDMLDRPEEEAGSVLSTAKS